MTSRKSNVVDPFLECELNYRVDGIKKIENNFEHRGRDRQRDNVDISKKEREFKQKSLITLLFKSCKVMSAITGDVDVPKVCW